MAENKLFGYSSSPHIKGKRTTKWIMANVCIALLPTTVMGIIYFGLKALLLVFLSCLSALLSEFIYKLCAKKSVKEILAEFDFTSLVTGMLVALAIGVNYPWYAPVLGSAFAIIVVKMFFGGTGKNIVNPAVASRIFIFISFQTVVGKWVAPITGDIVTGPTVLEGILSGTSTNPSLLNLFLGIDVAGCIGETCKLAILVGAIYLAILKIIDIRLPLIYVAITGLMTVALNGFDFTYFLPSILSGGLILGAFFMATDYVTSPNTFIGNIIYFVALGIVTAILRQATHMETVSFAILLLNLVVPLIDKFVLPKPFGYKKPQKEGK